MLFRSPTPPEVLAADGRYQGGLWLLAEVDLSRIDTRPVRLNVSLPALCAVAGAWPQGALRSKAIAIDGRCCRQTWRLRLPGSGEANPQPDSTQLKTLLDPPYPLNDLIQLQLMAGIRFITGSHLSLHIDHRRF